MKHAFRCLFFLSVAFLVFPTWGDGAEFPRPRGLVNDFANVVSPQVEQSLVALTGELLQKTGKRAGEYLKISRACTVKNWKDSLISEFDMKLPLNLGECVIIPLGSVILFAAGPNIGKTCLSMELCYLNRHLSPDYYSSELHEAMFAKRAVKRAPLEEWTNTFIDKWRPVCITCMGD